MGHREGTWRLSYQMVLGCAISLSRTPPSQSPDSRRVDMRVARDWPRLHKGAPANPCTGVHISPHHEKEGA